MYGRAPAGSGCGRAHRYQKARARPCQAFGGRHRSRPASLVRARSASAARSNLVYQPESVAAARESAARTRLDRRSPRASRSRLRRLVLAAWISLLGMLLGEAKMRRREDAKTRGCEGLCTVRRREDAKTRRRED